MSTATAVLDLEKAGFTREQVEALARFHEAQIDVSQLATKADLRADLAELRADLLKWMVGLLLGQAALVATLVKLL
jgi:hypothetical protein